MLLFCIICSIQIPSAFFLNLGLTLCVISLQHWKIWFFFFLMSQCSASFTLIERLSTLKICTSPDLFSSIGINCNGGKILILGKLNFPAACYSFFPTVSTLFSILIKNIFCPICRDIFNLFGCMLEPATVSVSLLNSFHAQFIVDIILQCLSVPYCWMIQRVDLLRDISFTQSINFQLKKKGKNIHTHTHLMILFGRIMNHFTHYLNAIYVEFSSHP